MSSEIFNFQKKIFKKRGLFCFQLLISYSLRQFNARLFNVKLRLPCVIKPLKFEILLVFRQKPNSSQEQRLNLQIPTT